MQLLFRQTAQHRKID